MAGVGHHLPLTITTYMSLARSYIPRWSELVRYGMPQFTIIRRPMLVNTQLLQPGDPVGPQDFCNLVRMQALYQQRLIGPVEGTIVKAPPKGTPGAMAQKHKTAVAAATISAIELNNAEFAIPDVDVPAAVEVEPGLGTVAPASYFARPSKPANKNKKRK